MSLHLHLLITSPMTINLLIPNMATNKEGLISSNQLINPTNSCNSINNSNNNQITLTNNIKIDFQRRAFIRPRKLNPLKIHQSKINHHSHPKMTFHTNLNKTIMGTFPQLEKQASIKFRMKHLWIWMVWWKMSSLINYLRSLKLNKSCWRFLEWILK